MKLKLILTLVVLGPLFSHAQKTFVHPGISHKQSDLDRMYHMVQAEVEPYYSSYEKLKSDAKASYDYTVLGDPSFTVITEKSTNSNEFKSDVEAAYLNALMWVVTRDSRHADKCVEIFTAWSNLTCFTGGGTESLNSGRVIFCFLDAAEIIKSTYDGWAEDDLQKFKDMLVYPGYSNVAKPESVTSDNGTFYWRLYQGDAGRHGNQDLFGWRGVLSMGIFLDNEIMYDRALRYLKGLDHRSDDIPYETGPPIISSSPSAESTYFDTYDLSGREETIEDYGYNGVLANYIWENGQCQESSRDQSHTILGVGQIASMAEMAWNQGDDVYSLLDNRILMGYEFTLRYNVSYKHPFPDQLDPWEPTVENGEFIQRSDRSGRWFSKAINPYKESDFESITRGEFLASARPVYELPYAHYKVRQGVADEDMVWLTRGREVSLEETGQEQNGYGLDHLGYGGLTCYRPMGCAGDPISGIDTEDVPIFEMNVLPGTVEAENFDHFNGGGESRVYHDTDDVNAGGEYRTDVGVDITECSEGGYALSDLKQGEWVTYTCFIPEAGTYSISMRYAATDETGVVAAALNETEISGDISLPSTGGTTTWADKVIVDELVLEQGLHPIRFYSKGGDNAFEFNNFTITLVEENTGPTVAITSPTNDTELIAGESTTITVDASDKEGTVEKVEFYIGNNMLGEDTTAPYSIDWNYMPEGTYSLTAVAYDNNQASTTSTAVEVTIKEGVGDDVTVSLPVLADTYVYSSNGTTSYGAETYMVTKSSGRYVYVKFDLTEIKGPITSAELQMYSKHTKTTTRSTYRVYDDSWLEDEINWGNQPPYTTEISSVSPIKQGIVTWDVTDFVAIENGGDGTVTLVVKDTYNSSEGVDFYTKESDENAPVLNVTYSLDEENTAPTVTVTSPSKDSNLTAGESTTITVDASDKEGTVEKVEFYIGDNMLGEDTTAPYSIDWNYMPEGTYSITAIAYDNYQASTTSTAVEVTIKEGTGDTETVSLPALADTYVHSSIATTNYGADTYMVTKSSERYVYLKFDLTEIDGPISSAELQLYSKHTKTTTRSTYRVYDDSWLEDEINWENQPTYASEISSVSPIQQGVVTWDVTDFVAIENGGDGTVTLVVKDTYDSSEGVDFYTKESGENVPVLNVTYLSPSEPLGVEEATQKSTASFYPNPVQKLLTIVSEVPVASIAIFDSVGRCLSERTNEYSVTNIQVDMSNYSSGIYFIQLKNSTSVEQLKVIKQ